MAEHEQRQQQQEGLRRKFGDAYMLAVFDWATARAPVGLESVNSLKKHHSGLKTDHERRHSEEVCHVLLERSLSAHLDCGGDQLLPSSPKERIRRRELGRGNGFSMEGSAFCSYAHRDGVHVLFAGEVAVWPGGVDAVSEAHDAFMRDVAAEQGGGNGGKDGEGGGGGGSDGGISRAGRDGGGGGEGSAMMSDATWLLSFYESFASCAEDSADRVLSSLSDVEGRFAFVLFDERRRRVMAARDAAGAECLYWGVIDEGQLLIGTDLSDLEACEPSATEFPAGTLYMSRGDTLAEHPGERGWVIAGEQWPGRLFSFVKKGGQHRRRHAARRRVGGEENGQAGELEDEHDEGDEEDEEEEAEKVEEEGEEASGDDEMAFRKVKEIPRLNSKGVLCGSVFRVESDRDLVGAQNDVQTC